MIVRVVEYDCEWPLLFDEEAERLREIFDQDIIEIHHIGSTAVPDMWAKPVIDMMPLVTDIEIVDEYNEAMTAIGYEPMGEYGLPGRRFFRRGRDIRTHNVHFYQYGASNEVIRHLAFRDYLRSHPDAALRYCELKWKLAQKYRRDIEGYMDGKDAFIKEIEKKAIDWYKALPLEERDF